MNCIDVHRKLATDPANRDEAVITHLEQCSACSSFAKSIDQFDNSLLNAANVDVPDGLVERILLKQSFKQQRYQRNNRFKFYGLVASIILVVGVSLNLKNFNIILNHTLSLEEVAINHVTSEIDHLHEKKNIQLAKLNTMLQPFNLKFKNKIGQINYAGSCPIRKSRGVHIVVQGEKETATLLVMPGEYIQSRKSHTKGDFTTTLLPTDNGSIAIVSNKNGEAEFVKELEKDLKNSIHFI